MGGLSKNITFLFIFIRIFSKTPFEGFITIKISLGFLGFFKSFIRRHSILIILIATFMLFLIMAKVGFVKASICGKRLFFLQSFLLGLISLIRLNIILGFQRREGFWGYIALNCDWSKCRPLNYLTLKLSQEVKLEKEVLLLRKLL